MFEEEAEERVRDYIIKSRDCLTQPCKTLEDCQQKELEFDEVVELVKDSMEFAYNKATEEYAIKLKEFVETCNHWQEVAEKANEWHYVNWKYFADKDYPESETASYLVQLRNKDALICEWEIEDGFGCFWGSNLEPIDNDDVYAWKEIIFPEETEK